MADLSQLSQQQKIQWLKSQGVSDEAIQARLGGQQPSPTARPEISRKYDDAGGVRGLLEKLALSGLIPTTTATVGSVLGGLAGGTAAGIPTLGLGATGGAIAGAGMGGGAGYAGGRSIQENMQDLLGVQDESPGRQVASAGMGTAGSTAAGAAGEGIGMAGAGLLSKLGTKLFGFGLSKPTNVATREFTERAIREATGEAGEDIAPRMIREGITGSPENWLNIANKGKQEAYNRALDIAEAASKAEPGLVTQGTQTAGKQTVLNVNEAFGEALAKGLAETPPGFIQDAGPAYQQVYEEIIRKYGNDLSVEDLIELNKLINSKLYTAADNPSTSQAAKSEAYRALDSVIKPYLRDNYPEVADALADYGFYSQVESIAKYTGRKQPTPPSNILQTLNLPFKVLKNPQFTTKVGSSMANPALSGYLGAAGAGLGSSSQAGQSAQLR